MSGTEKPASAGKPATAGQIDEKAEAESLAREALEAEQQGDKDEAKFLAEEARALDPKAAESVLKDKAQAKERS